MQFNLMNQQNMGHQNLGQQQQQQWVNPQLMAQMQDYSG